MKPLVPALVSSLLAATVTARPPPAGQIVARDHPYTLIWVSMDPVHFTPVTTQTLVVNMPDPTGDFTWTATHYDPITLTGSPTSAGSPVPPPTMTGPLTWVR